MLLEIVQKINLSIYELSWEIFLKLSKYNLKIRIIYDPIKIDLFTILSYSEPNNLY